jgi:hypothetical protein
MEFAKDWATGFGIPGNQTPEEVIRIKAERFDQVYKAIIKTLTSPIEVPKA